MFGFSMEMITSGQIRVKDKSGSCSFVTSSRAPTDGSERQMFFLFFRCMDEVLVGRSGDCSIARSSDAFARFHWRHPVGKIISPRGIKGTPPKKNTFSFRHCPNYPPPPNHDNVIIVNNEYDFGTFDDFGVKMTKKYTHNMILMSRYKRQLHGGKRPPPFSGDAWKKTFFCGRCSIRYR